MEKPKQISVVPEFFFVGASVFTMAIGWCMSAPYLFAASCVIFLLMAIEIGRIKITNAINALNQKPD